MDSYRGVWGELPGGAPYPDDDFDDDLGAYDLGRPQAPPTPVGQEEQRLQVRAYNMWASLLKNRDFPAIDELDLPALPEFAPHAVLLDFTQSLDNPTLAYLGARLAAEHGAPGPVRRLSDVPGHSLLARITDHYLQIFANQAPIGFEAEFTTQQDRTLLYRGILLPFAGAGAGISHVLGVINWKELASQQLTGQLLHEIALHEITQTPQAPAWTAPAAAGPALWADGPAIGTPGPDAMTMPPPAAPDLSGHPALSKGAIAWPAPGFGALDGPQLAPPAAHPACLADWLAAARAAAAGALATEDRSRKALYAALGRAWDFALAATEAPAEFARLLAEAGIAAPPRAPLTPVAKLVFGPGYDKTRLAEHTRVLGAARRLGLGVGELAGWLADVAGGIKGAVAEERRLKRMASGHPAPCPHPGKALAGRLRMLAPLPLGEIAPEGAEFTLLVARRGAAGVELLGEVGGDAALVARAARRLLPPA